MSYRSVVLVLAIWQTIFFGWWANGAFTHASFMKCRYRPLWKEATVRFRETTMLVTLPVEVRNRSEGRIDPSELKIVVRGEGVVEGDVTLNGPFIQGGETTQITLSFAAKLSEKAILDLPKFLEAGYSAHLRLEPPLSRPVLLEIFPQ